MRKEAAFAARVRAFLRFAAQAAVGGAGRARADRPSRDASLAASAFDPRLGPLDEQRPAGGPRRGLMLGRAWSRAGGSGAGAGLAWQSRRVTDPVNVQAVETAGASQGRPVSRGATGLHGVARKERVQTSGRRGRQPRQRRRRWGPRSAVGARSGQPGAEATGPGALLSRSACRRDPEDRSVKSRPQQLYRCRRWSDGPGGRRVAVFSELRRRVRPPPQDWLRDTGSRGGRGPAQGPGACSAGGGNRCGANAGRERRQV